jgi:hypothetical protein
MKLLKTITLIVSFGATVFAQSYSTTITPGSSKTGDITNSATDTVKILAVMAEFQPDNDNTTVGNGTFNSIYSQEYGSSIVDPLPHNRNYFLAHLEFVKNYYHKVSGGKQVVVFEVLPNSVTLSKTMRNYSPPINSTDFTVMGDFVQETWTLADQANPGFNFGGYNLFFIFHAGVGRDVSLPGSLGNERDLPSIYFNLASLQKFYGSGFQGVPVSNGSVFIKNTGILPQTQNREVSSFNSKFLYNITINGLLASTVASYLGLPDLFDTNTGMSAIGRFGLMDGQSIFAYNGAFPPEPSPWEKIRLGWVTPVELTGTLADLTVVTNRIAVTGDTTLIKLRINENEYFLIENRQRDAFKDGAKITLMVNGSVIVKSFPKDTTGFASYSIDSLSGVLMDVDEFDWALPGSGILVWHIDEKVINEKIADNKVNTDKRRRGVAVVEADGVNDIGEKFLTIFGDEVIGEGTEYDFYFLENKADLYTNILSNTSRPNSKSNDGANSLVTMKNFPANGNSMKFTLSVGDSLIKPFLNGKTAQNDKIDQILVSGNNYFVMSGNDLLQIDANMNVTNRYPGFSSQTVATLEANNTYYIAGASGNTINLAKVTGGMAVLSSLTVTSTITSQIIISSNSFESNRIAAGNIAGEVYRIALDPLTLLDSIKGEAGFAINSLFLRNGTLKYIQKKSSSSYNVGDFASGLITVNGNYLDAVMMQSPVGYSLLVLEEGNKIRQFPEPVETTQKPATSPTIRSDYVTLKGASPITSISVSDNKLDGNLYVNYVSGQEFYSVNTSGSVAENFPFTISGSDVFEGTPVAADLYGTSHPELVGYTKSGLVYVIDAASGKMVNGFPLSVGEQLKDYQTFAPVFFTSAGKTGLAVTGKSGYMSSWLLNELTSTVHFSGRYGNAQNSSSVNASSGQLKISEYFPQAKVYNYPNPVISGETYIRFFVSEDSDISVKIFDLAGDYVAGLSGFASGGLDGEIKWNVSAIESGVYLARVEAKSVVSGKTDHKIIKIAIIK